MPNIYGKMIISPLQFLSIKQQQLNLGDQHYLHTKIRLKYCKKGKPQNRFFHENKLKIPQHAGCQWLTLVILTTQEAEIRRIVV
jgi:hypothetical protein